MSLGSFHNNADFIVWYSTEFGASATFPLHFIYLRWIGVHLANKCAANEKKNIGSLNVEKSQRATALIASIVFGDLGNRTCEIAKLRRRSNLWQISVEKH